MQVQFPKGNVLFVPQERSSDLSHVIDMLWSSQFLWCSPPNSSTEIFSHFESSVGKLVAENFEFYLMGDFNCNLASWQPDISTVWLTNIVDIHNLHQPIDSPTRITNTPSTLIDVTFTNCQNNIVSAGVSHVSLSDHSLVYAFRKISINSPKSHSTLTLRLNVDSARFGYDISTKDWDRVNSFDDPNVMWAIWTHKQTR